MKFWQLPLPLINLMKAPLPENDERQSHCLIWVWYISHQTGNLDDSQSQEIVLTTIFILYILLSIRPRLKIDKSWSILLCCYSFTDCRAKRWSTLAVWYQVLYRVTFQFVRNNTEILECQSCKTTRWSCMRMMTVMALMLIILILPLSETTVSTVKELIWSRLNMSGLGKGKGTFFNNNSRGVAIACNQWKHVRQKNTYLQA